MRSVKATLKQWRLWQNELAVLGRKGRSVPRSTLDAMAEHLASPGHGVSSPEFGVVIKPVEVARSDWRDVVDRHAEKVKLVIIDR